MEWSDEAAAAVARVPFFVRKRVRKKVEEEARQQGCDRVVMAHVKSAQARYMGNMEAELKGYQVESCFGPSGCPNRLGEDDRLAARIEEYLASLDLKAFLKERVAGPLKMHHEFRVSISDCPNGCSRPQIVDVGFLGACQPGLTEEPCSRCNACVESCREDAIFLADGCCPVIDFDKCLGCGHCLRVCPTGTLAEAVRGYRIQVGGKLGRHPQLGRELPGIFPADQALAVLKRCLDLYLAHFQGKGRFGDIVNRVGCDGLLKSQPAGAKPA